MPALVRRSRAARARHEPSGRLDSKDGAPS